MMLGERLLWSHRVVGFIHQGGLRVESSLGECPRRGTSLNGELTHQLVQLGLVHTHL